MSAENAWRIAREILATMPTKYLARCPIPPAFEAAFRAAVEAEVGEMREMLAEALPLVEEREFLEETEYSYGSGWPEPSPAEWGIHCGYQQTADAMPYQQFEEDVERHHRTNREEDDGDGKFLTLANRIRALLSRLEAKGEEKP